MMKSSTTVLTVRDIRVSLSYYRDALGFDTAFEYGAPVSYAGVCSGSVTIHLASESHTPRQAGHGAVAIDVTDVDALYAGFVARGAKVLNAPTNQDYGLRDFAVADPDGNMLFFSMYIPTT